MYSITMSDIEAVEYQLESTLGFKYYEVNNSDLHIKRESDIANEDHGASNVEFRDDNYKSIEVELLEPKQEVDIDFKHDTEQIFVCVSNDIIKFEKEDYGEEPQEEAGLQIPEHVTNIKKSLSDDEEITNVSNVSEKVEGENKKVNMKKGICENVKQKRKRKHTNVTALSNQSKSLSHCKKQRLVLEDVMLSVRKKYIQESFKELTNNDNSKKDKKSPIKNASLLEDGINNTDFITTAKSSIRDPKNTSKTNARSSTFNSNIYLTHDPESPEKLICDICDKSFKNKTILVQHIQKHSNMYSCTYCNFKTKHNNSLKKHINSLHTKNIVYTCPFCNHTTYRHYSLVKHVNTKHTKSEVYNCSNCIYKTYTKEALTTHINIKHTKNIVFNCSYCSYKAYDKSYIRRHVNAHHTKTTVFNCPHCEYKTSDKRYIHRHINTKHTNKNSDKEHVNAEHTKKVHICSYCSFQTFRKDNLASHINTIHTKDTVFKCPHCTYEAYNKPRLSTHIKAKHSKSIGFKCKYCSYKGCDSSSISKHVNAKHTKNAYNCTYCSFVTYRKDILAYHINAQHTKETVFKCPHCSYEAYKKARLDIHVNAKHTKTVVFNCSDCNYTTYIRNSLSTHVRAKHSKKTAIKC